jgi:hypothetical protein
MKRLFLALALLSGLAFGQTTLVTATKVVDNNGAPLNVGNLCFGTTCLPVTSGAITTGSLASGTYTVTVTNSSTTFLTVPGVNVAGAAFSWDMFVVPATASISGVGAPRIACYPGAAYAQTDGLQNHWQCVSINGVGTWNGIQLTQKFGSLTIGTVTNGQPGGTAAVTNSGTASDAILNFILPSGVPGLGYIAGVSSNGSNGLTIAGTPSAITDADTVGARNTAIGNAVPVVGTANPLMNGTAASGSTGKWADAGHVHPSDTSRVPTTQTVNGHALSAPVTVTASDVGLGNVTNTSDVNKPVSTAQAAAIAALTGATAHNESVPANCVAASASGTAYTCATSLTFTPAAGDHIQFKADVANTASATLAVNGAAAATIKKQGGSGNLIANDLLAAHWISATFDGTYWQLEGQLGNAPAPSNASTTVNGVACALGSSCTVADSTKVPTTQTVNGHALSGAVVVSASDLTTGTLPAAGLPLSGVTAGSYTASNITVDSYGRVTAASSGSVSAGVSVVGSFRNLAASATGSSATVTVTADEIVLENSSNTYVTGRAVSLSIAGTTSGAANGLDTGSLAASTWYSVWVIYNGSTVAGLLSLSATTPTLPSGYTYKARVGWIKTGSGSPYYPLAFKQLGRRVQYMLYPPLIAAGNAGAQSTPTWVAVTVSGASIPTTASVIHLIVQVTSSGGSNNYVMLAPNNSYGAYNSAVNPPPYVLDSYLQAWTQAADMLLESANIYWISGTSLGQIFVSGWEDNL